MSVLLESTYIFDFSTSHDNYLHVSISKGLPCGSEGKASACSVGDLGSIPGSKRSPGEGNGNPLQ